MVKNLLNKSFPIRSAAALLPALILLCALGGCSTARGAEFTLPARVLAESQEELTFGDYKYLAYDDGTIILTAYGGSESSVAIPSSIDGKKVIALGVELFFGNSEIQSVTIGDNIEIIGDYAFFACESLTRVSIGKKVWSVGAAAFENTPWMRAQTDDFVVAGDGVLLAYIGKDKYVRVPDGVKHLSSAFGANNNIIYVELGDSVLTLGHYAFASCENLRQVKFGKNLRLIGDNALEGCERLTAADIPDRVEKIGDFAFNGCFGLLTARVGSSVKSIGAYAFNQCTRLSSISLPASLEGIGDFAFRDCFSFGVVFYGGAEGRFAALGITESNYILKDAYKIWGVTGGGHEISG